jgi:hypothetical protein
LNWRRAKSKRAAQLDSRRLAAELLQKRSYLFCRGQLELKYGLDINIRKTQLRETRPERLADVLGGGARYLHERSKDNFVIGIGKYMRGEALEDFGARLMVERRGAKRCEEPPFDLGGL